MSFDHLHSRWIRPLSGPLLASPDNTSLKCHGWHPLILHPVLATSGSMEFTDTGSAHVGELSTRSSAGADEMQRRQPALAEILSALTRPCPDLQVHSVSLGEIELERHERHDHARILKKERAQGHLTNPKTACSWRLLRWPRLAWATTASASPMGQAPVTASATTPASTRTWAR
jgi:hypothetical protein